MQVGQKKILALTACLFGSLLFGCSPPPQQVQIDQTRDLIDTRRNGLIAKRFQEPDQSPTPIESAVELSEKYAALSKRAAELQKKNNDFAEENTAMKKQIATLQHELDQAQKELTEANDLLIEMHIELNNWKSSILGFRGEMREAEKAQLEALLKILKILGAEVSPEPAQAETPIPDNPADVNSAETVPSELLHARVQETPNQEKLDE
jgi:septal ring factor EnvC (AmiA/AmiB activator)